MYLLKIICNTTTALIPTTYSVTSELINHAPYRLTGRNLKKQSWSTAVKGIAGHTVKSLPSSRSVLYQPVNNNTRIQDNHRAQTKTPRVGKARGAVGDVLIPSHPLLISVAIS